MARGQILKAAVTDPVLTIVHSDLGWKAVAKGQDLKIVDIHQK